jgi:hypothetical protein
MTIERDRKDGSIIFVCDCCGDPCFTESRDFTDALEAFKAEGGAARNEDGEWQHYCIACE